MMGTSLRQEARIVDDRTAGNRKLSDLERWGIVIDAIESLDCLTTMVTVMDQNEEPVPHSVASLMQAVSCRLSTALSGIAVA